MRIVKDHWHFRSIKRTRPWAIHTECMHKENVWKATQKFVKSGNSALWFVVTPENFDFVKTETGVSMDQKKWEKTIADRYKWLKDQGQEIQLHVHLRIKMSMYSKEEAIKDIEKKISGSIRWLKNIGIVPDKIVFGWWSFNDYAVKFANKNNMQVMGRLENYFIHDYDLLELV